MTYEPNGRGNRNFSPLNKTSQNPHFGAVSGLGRPGSPAAFATVSVIARSAVLADALSTAVCVVGPDKGADLLRQFEAEAYGLTKDGAVWSSPGFPRDRLA